MKLTIAIPTYDRYEALERTLKIIIPQLYDGVELLIIDNASPKCINNLVNELACTNKVLNHVRVIRNKYNIGANANIMRCFELAQGEWMWLLSDDDRPLIDSVQTVLDEVKDSKAIGICFRSQLSDWSEARHEAATLAELIDIPKRGIGGLLFMSSWVFKIDIVAPKLRYGYQYIYTCASHLILVLESLKQYEGVVVLHQRQLVDWVHDKNGWSCLQAYFGMASLNDVISTGINKDDYRCKQKVLSDIMPYWAYFIGIHLLNDVSASHIRFMLNSYSGRIKDKKLTGIKDMMFDCCAHVLTFSPLSFRRWIVHIFSSQSKQNSGQLMNRL